MKITPERTIEEAARFVIKEARKNRDALMDIMETAVMYGLNSVSHDIPELKGKSKEQAHNIIWDEVVRLAPKSWKLSHNNGGNN